MTITRTQADISSLLGKVSFNQGQADVDKLKAKDARQLLSAMAKDSLNAGGNVKSGYFRVLTDKDGNITEIGRSSMSSKGRDKATDLIKALVAKAFGEGSAEQESLTTYLETSGDKVGSKSLVKLIAAKSIQSETDGSASMESVAMRNQFTPEQQTAFSTYMRRVGDDAHNDTTGRLRLHSEDKAGGVQNAIADKVERSEPKPFALGGQTNRVSGSPKTLSPSHLENSQSGDPYDLIHQSSLDGAKSFLNPAGPVAGGSHEDQVDPYDIEASQTNKQAQKLEKRKPSNTDPIPVGTPDFRRSGFLGGDK